MRVAQFPTLNTSMGITMEILNEDWEGEDVWFVDDPRVPQVIREHGARFRNPARYVIAVDGEYLLYGADGELLDLCRLR